ncbi:MAG: putative acetolactate synthase large subunit IlvX [Alphaproteobacteria bacterium MarineAlpha4_Bin2]|nr:MAG: putative acetolactate synthase large subunit IlvX [Alphaproteobacteria bacterium MarineAlpha4_Bin2]
MSDNLDMNGAESLVRTLLAGGIDICFTNPGTSEMHFVAALDKVPGMRCILGLFEGILTGAADGYYRMMGKPASTLLHLGPGLANGLANLHNAKKANSGVVNVVGEHTTYHIKHDAPLTSDIEGVARPMSHWVRTSLSSLDVAADGAAAIEAATSAPGQIATLILPADTAWGPAERVVTARPPISRTNVTESAVTGAAEILTNGRPATMLLAGASLTEEGLKIAGRIAGKTGCGLLSEGANARLARGAGLPQVLRIPFVVDLAVEMLKSAGQLVLVGAKPPVAFFGYPGKPSLLYQEGVPMTRLANAEDDIIAALEALEAELGAQNSEMAHVAPQGKPDRPTGDPTLDNLAAVMGNMLPENAIVIDESVTTGRGFFPATAGAARHDWLNNRGGSIGFGMPVAIGAAVAAPDRKVILLEGDGSGMYTVQSLWTMAREQLDVTTIVFSNRSYKILRGELSNVGVQNPGPRAIDMLTLDRPDLGWVEMARGMGVTAEQVSDCEGLMRAMEVGLQTDGPYLIELVM